MHDFDLDWLQLSVLNCIDETRFGDAMRLIKSFVERVLNDEEAVGVVFASRELDALCEKLAEAYYANLPVSNQTERCGTVILVSELVRAGGHVELIKDYLALRIFEGPVRIALTDVFNRVHRASREEWELQFGCEIFIASEGEVDGKLSELTAQLCAWQPKAIVTLGHNQDVVCIAAAHIPGPQNRYYIHHGDHHLSLGVTCSALQHVDLHNMSHHWCKTQVGAAGLLYWPLSSIRPSCVKSSFLERGTVTTASCGRMYKFEAGSYTIRYEHAVSLILTATGGHHVHFGDLSDAFLQRIYAELDAKKIDRARFVHIDWVASLPRALIDYGVDVYVSSFPVGGGKSLIDAMSAGIPTVVHESYRSRYHSSTDLAYPESFVWRRYEELALIFEQWNESLLRQQADRALEHFERFYSRNAFMNAFASGVDCDSFVPPLRAYRGDPLARYLEFKGCKEKELARHESERDRILREWKKVYDAYEAHSKTILAQQALIAKMEQK